MYPLLLDATQNVKCSPDDDTYLNHPASPDLGTIKLDIVKVKLTRKRGQTDVLKYTKPGKVHEQSKKALSHRAQ